MKHSDFVTELKPVVAAQRAILETITVTVESLEPSLSLSSRHATDLVELSKLIDELEADPGLLPEDLDGIDEDIRVAVADRSIRYDNEIKSLNFSNWNDFVRQSQVYCLANKADYSLPWESFLSGNDLELLKNEDYGLQYKWDKWDYIFVGAAGVIASLTDYLLVGLPKDINYLGKFPQNDKSKITEFLKSKIDSTKGADSWFADFARACEKICKVPYDSAMEATGGLGGMHPKTHRLQSFGHDPILGLVFGILDIYRGTMTGFSYDRLAGVHSFTVKQMTEGNGVSLLEALLTQLGHLVSDVGTSQGVPPPFFGLFQGINIPAPMSEKGRTIGEVARWMYLNGFDLRHFITQGITPAVIEIILRAYIMIRHYSEKGEVKFVLADNPKYRSMLLSAHAIACAGNAGKIALYQGNPLAINYSEWLALTRYLVPSLKYWIFDKRNLQLAHYQKINDDAWSELTFSGTALLEKVYAETLEVVQLGEIESGYP